MSPRSKREYIEAVHLRYKHASHKGKTIILDEFCAICGYYRKHAIRLLRSFKRFTKPKSKRRGGEPYLSRRCHPEALKTYLAGRQSPLFKTTESNFTTLVARL